MTVLSADIINTALLIFMAGTACALIYLRNLFAVVMLFGIFSLSAAAVYVDMDAVDVAFTEAAVGAGVSTVLMLTTLVLTGAHEKARHRLRPLPLALSAAVCALLIYGTLDMPHYGDPGAPAHNHVAPRYLDRSAEEVGLPNAVTSVLASYRGYDTLGEVAVVFTAAAGVLAVIGRGRRRRNKKTQDAAP